MIVRAAYRMVNWTYVIVTVVYAAMAAGGCVVSNANAVPLNPLAHRFLPLPTFILQLSLNSQERSTGSIVV